MIIKAVGVVLILMLVVMLVVIERSVLKDLGWDILILRWLSYVLVSLATWIVIS